MSAKPSLNDLAIRSSSGHAYGEGAPIPSKETSLENIQKLYSEHYRKKKKESDKAVAVGMGLSLTCAIGFLAVGTAAVAGVATISLASIPIVATAGTLMLMSGVAKLRSMSFSENSYRKQGNKTLSKFAKKQGVEIESKQKKTEILSKFTKKETSKITAEDTAKNGKTEILVKTVHLGSTGGVGAAVNEKTKSMSLNELKTHYKNYHSKKAKDYKDAQNIGVGLTAVCGVAALGVIVVTHLAIPAIPLIATAYALGATSIFAKIKSSSYFNKAFKDPDNKSLSTHAKEKNIKVKLKTPAGTKMNT